MKCRLDGPRPEDVAYRAVVDGSTKVVGTVRCQAIQASYEALHGVASKGSSKDGLPRRATKRSRDDPGSAAAQKRRREAQIRDSAAAEVEVSGVDAEKRAELAELESITLKNARSRFGKRQESYQNTLQQYANAKRKLASEDMSPPNPESEAGRKLAAHLAELANTAKMKELEQRSLSLNIEKPSLPVETVVVATCPAAEAQVHAVRGVFKLWPPRSADCVALATELLQSRTPLVWLCSDGDEEQAMFYPDNDYSTFTSCARLLGGFVATMYWLRLAVSEDRMLQPIVRLKRGMDCPHELHFDKTMEQEATSAARGMAIAYRAAIDASVSIKWVVRKKSKELILGQLSYINEDVQDFPLRV